MGDNLCWAQTKLRIAARALANANLVHAYGHCSVRLDQQSFLVCAPHPMGTLSPGEDGDVVPVTGALPEGVLGEVRIHQQIYQRNPEAEAICRIMPPSLMTLSTLRRTPSPRHGLGAYFGQITPLWDDPRLLRNDAAAAALAALMANSPAVVMRGNGAVVRGDSLEQAVAYSWFLEDAARVELQTLALNLEASEGLLNDQEIIDRQVMTGRVFERMWRHLAYGDPELHTLTQIEQQLHR
jgi:HCOMODA/2-hydroxy-3-carboxy-muconic semialdehyde decarboxylase